MLLFEYPKSLSPLNQWFKYRQLQKKKPVFWFFEWKQSVKLVFCIYSFNLYLKFHELILARRATYDSLGRSPRFKGPTTNELRRSGIDCILCEMMPPFGLGCVGDILPQGLRHFEPRAHATGLYYVALRANLFLNYVRS